ncbi:MAG TPA: hypothetical protein DDW41_06435 [Candidatus Andersenbacteria bacterium]|nr:hypothetical protein [Candidatus Andersenbacteria bacterium]
MILSSYYGICHHNSMGTQVSSFSDYVVTDLLRDVPGIVLRRMFGGHGVYQRDVMFGLIDRGTLYFKADNTSRLQFEQHGSKPFSYQRQGKQTKLTSFWEVPADILDDRLVLVEWVEAALAAARREKSKKEAKISQPKRGLAGVKEKFHQLTKEKQNDLLRDLYKISPDTKTFLESRLLGTASSQHQYIKEMERETIGKIYRKGIPGDISGRAVNSIVSRAWKAEVDLDTMLQLEWLAFRGFQEYLHQFGGGPETFEEMACKHLEAYLLLVRDGVKDKAEQQRRYAEAASHILRHDNMVTDYAEDTFDEIIGARPQEAKNW